MLNKIHSSLNCICLLRFKVSQGSRLKAGRRIATWLLVIGSGSILLRSMHPQRSNPHFAWRKEDQDAIYVHKHSRSRQIAQLPVVLKSGCAGRQANPTIQGSENQLSTTYLACSHNLKRSTPSRYPRQSSCLRLVNRPSGTGEQARCRTSKHETRFLCPAHIQSADFLLAQQLGPRRFVSSSLYA